MRPIEQLNELAPAEFAEALTPLFEAAAPLAGALFAARPYASYGELIERAERLALAMPVTDQVAVLSAHPRIGADPATLSAFSSREQGAEEPRWVYDQLAQLNTEYEARFGLRFVVFVNRRPKAEILTVLMQRLNNSREDELRTGLHEMFLIARDRYAAFKST